MWTRGWMEEKELGDEVWEVREGLANGLGTLEGLRLFWGSWAWAGGIQLANGKRLRSKALVWLRQKGPRLKQLIVFTEAEFPAVIWKIPRFHSPNLIRLPISWACLFSHQVVLFRSFSLTGLFLICSLVREDCLIELAVNQVSLNKPDS